jgi:hypothetical protein
VCNFQIFRLKNGLRLVFSFVLLIPFMASSTALAGEGDDLLHAAYYGHIKKVQSLLDRGVDVNFQNEGDGASVLHVASQKGRKKIARMLLNRGAKVNLQNKEGDTALMAAAFNGHKDIVEILVLAGAEVNHQSPADETALSLAREERRKKIVQLLVHLGAKELKKRCPNPNVKYKDWSVQVYWQWFVAGYITERTQTDKTLCAKYSYQDEHSVQRGSIMFPLGKLESREQKEAGLVGGIKIFYAMNEVYFAQLTDELRQHYKIDRNFMERDAPRFESITGLQFATALEWFEWIQSNKDRLALSPDGKHVVVR